MATANASKDTATTKAYTVARGRSVVHDGRPYDAGATVNLSEDEGERLRALGFFLDDDGDFVARSEGPAPTTGDVTIKEL